MIRKLPDGRYRIYAKGRSSMSDRSSISSGNENPLQRRSNHKRAWLAPGLGCDGPKSPACFHTGRSAWETCDGEGEHEVLGKTPERRGGNAAYGSLRNGLIRSTMNRPLSSLFLFCSLSAWAQSDHLPPRPVAIDTLSSNNGALTRVENQPQFPGGEQALVEYMRTSMHYPEAMEKARVAGTVKVAFTIADDGQVQNAHVQTGIPNGEDLNKEALRVVHAMPRWEPAHVYGVAVPMDYLLPVTFVLQEEH